MLEHVFRSVELFLTRKDRNSCHKRRNELKVLAGTNRVCRKQTEQLGTVSRMMAEPVLEGLEGLVIAGDTL